MESSHTRVHTHKKHTHYHRQQKTGNLFYKLHARMETGFCFIFATLKKNKTEITHKLRSALMWRRNEPFSLVSLSFSRAPARPLSTPKHTGVFRHSLLHLNTTLCLSNRDLSRKQAESTTILLRFTAKFDFFFPPLLLL